MASTIATYVIDVSAPMADIVHDEETGRDVSKLDACKEYVARKIAPKVRRHYSSKDMATDHWL